MTEVTPDEYVRRVTEKIVRERYAEAERAIAAAMAEHKCRPEDLILEVKWDGSVLRVRPITYEERWLDWHSNNHGWE